MLLYWLSFLDLFRRPIYLRFKNQEKNPSKLGFFFSLGIYTLLIMEFIKSDIFHHSSPKIIDQPVTEIYRRHQKFSNKVFTVSVVDDESLAYADESIFTIIAKNVFMSSNDEGGYEFDHIENKALHLCTEKDFPSDPNVFDSLGLNNSYCLDDNHFETYGYWDEPQLAYFSLELYICDNLTSPVVCKTPEEISQFFVMKYFNLVYAGIKADVENYTNPISTKYRNDYKLIEPKFNKMMNIFLKTVTVNSDDGWIFAHNTEISDIGYDSSETDFSFLQNSTSSSGENPAIFTCDFYSARAYQSITRTYQKISEVFANVGGLMSFLIVCGFALTYIENTLSLQIQIINRLYSFQNINNKALPRNSLFSEETKYFINGNNNPHDHNNNLDTIIEAPHIVSQDNIIERISPSRKPPKPMNISMSLLPLQNVDTPFFLQPKNIADEPVEQEISPKKIQRPLKKSKTTLNLKKEFEMEKKGKRLENKENTNSNMLTSGKSESIKKKRNLPNSIQNLIIDTHRKSKAISEIQVIKEKNDNGLKISLWEFIKYNAHKICKCFKAGFKENLFLKAQKLYQDEMDIVTILQRLQEVEKLKYVLLSEEQNVLFSFLAKPLIYNDKRIFESKKGGVCLAEMKSPTFKDVPNLKKTLRHFETKKMLGRLSFSDARLLELLDENIEEYSRNFSQINK